MSEKERNDYFYVCALIEYIARETRNHRGDIVQAIGKFCSIMIEECAEPGNEVEELMKIFSPFISDAISNFNSDLYYQNPDYLEWSYREGKLLD